LTLSVLTANGIGVPGKRRPPQELFTATRRGSQEQGALFDPTEPPRLINEEEAIEAMGRDGRDGEDGSGAGKTGENWKKKH